MKSVMITVANGLTSARAQSLRIVTPVNGTHRMVPRQTTGMRHWGEYSEGWFQQDKFSAASPTTIIMLILFIYLNACMHAYSLLYKLLGTFRNSFPNGESPS